MKVLFNYECVCVMDECLWVCLRISVHARVFMNERLWVPEHLSVCVCVCHCVVGMCCGHVYV